MSEYSETLPTQEGSQDIVEDLVGRRRDVVRRASGAFLTSIIGPLVLTAGLFGYALVEGEAPDEGRPELEEFLLVGQVALLQEGQIVVGE